MLFHVSEEPDISCFEPRTSEQTAGLSVWAIDEMRLRNYLVPRDCPRVTFYAGETTTAEDVEHFLGASPAVVAIESAWFDKVLKCRLFCYHLPAETFECIDAGAGYFISRHPVVPDHCEVITNPIGHLMSRGVELRLLPSLWWLHDAVAASSLQFSMIRMRNAAPRPPA
jgi:hypothetical protein